MMAAGAGMTMRLNLVNTEPCDIRGRGEVGGAGAVLYGSSSCFMSHGRGVRHGEGLVTDLTNMHN